MVTQVLSDTLLSVRIQDKQIKGDWQNQAPQTIDLSKTPSQGFDTALYDDRGLGADGNMHPAYKDPSGLVLGITTIGSNTAPGMNDMRRGAYVGGLYIENSGYQALRKKGVVDTADAPWPPSGMNLYSYTSVAYPDGRRYHGFHGRLVSRDNQLLTLTLKGIAGWQTTNIIVDASQLAKCDPTPPVTAMSGATALRDATKPGTEGAIFLALPFAVGAGVPATKLPSGEG